MDLEKDFYETIDCVHEDGLISGKFIIYESDAKKGHRILHYALNSDSVYREEKF